MVLREYTIISPNTPLEECIPKQTLYSLIFNYFSCYGKKQALGMEEGKMGIIFG